MLIYEAGQQFFFYLQIQRLTQESKLLILVLIYLQLNLIVKSQTILKRKKK